MLYSYTFSSFVFINKYLVVENRKKTANRCFVRHLKVSEVLKDGLKLRDIRFRKAVRKDRDDNKPGVMIVTCENVEDNKTCYCLC